MVTAGHDIRTLTSAAGLRAAWPLVSQLRAEVDEDRELAGFIWDIARMTPVKPAA